MILTPEDRSRRLVAEGAWSRVTLDQAFRRGLDQAADAIVFQDVGASAVPGLGEGLSYAAAEARIEGLAAFFVGIGLKPDTVIGIHLPPCSDAAVILLAAIRAGLVVCALPLHWGPAEVSDAIAAAGIRAIVTASEIEGDGSGEMMRDVAAETFAIRFVFAVGYGVPDGLIDLRAVLDEIAGLGPAPEIQRRGPAADHVALLSFARSGDDRLLVVPFSHNHLVAGALAHAIEGRIGRGETILSTMHPVGLAGVTAGLLAGLLTGSTVAFHHVTSLAGLAGAAARSGATRVVLPAALGPAFAAASPETVLALVSSGLARDPAPAAPAGTRAVDVVTLGGLCAVPVARPADGQFAGLPAEPVRLPVAEGDGPVLFEARVKPRARAGERRVSTTAGDLLIGGAIVADAPWPEPASGGSGVVLSVGTDGQLRTEHTADVSAAGRIRVTGRRTDTIIVAGQPVSTARLDAVMAGHPAIADAAVFAVDTDLVGARLGVAVVPRPGQTVSLTELQAWLDEKRLPALERPATLIRVREIPRGADGAVQRDALFLGAVA